MWLEIATKPLQPVKFMCSANGIDKSWEDFLTFMPVLMQFLSVIVAFPSLVLIDTIPQNTLVKLAIRLRARQTWKRMIVSFLWFIMTVMKVKFGCHECIVAECIVNFEKLPTINVKCDKIIGDIMCGAFVEWQHIKLHVNVNVCACAWSRFIFHSIWQWSVELFRKCITQKVDEQKFASMLCALFAENVAHSIWNVPVSMEWKICDGLIYVSDEFGRAVKNE